MFNKNCSFKKLIAGGLSAFLLCTSAANAQVSSFDNLSTLLGSGGYWNGAGVSDYGQFEDGGATFPNLYETSFGGYWSSGWAYSNIINTTMAGFGNIYAAYPGTGANNSATYAIGQQDAVVKFSGTVTITGLQVTNGTYAALSMKNGDSFAKKFGGNSGNDPDYFKLTAYGYQSGILNTATGMDFYLSDFRSSITGEHFILDTWKTFNLSALGGIDSILFQLSSSDVGTFGINTPLFFCIDNLSISGGNVADFENLDLSANSYWNKQSRGIKTGFRDGEAYFHSKYSVSNYGDYWSQGFVYSKVNNTTLAGYANEYAAITGNGNNNSDVYAVSYGTSSVKLSFATTVLGFYTTNTTYAYLSMKNGDYYAKKFGGENGNDPDYFKLIVMGFLNGIAKTDTVDFYLADFRNSDNTKDYILNSWQLVDLQKLGVVDSLVFALSSSDAGIYGINTPLYFAMDDFSVAPAGTVTGINEGADATTFRFYPNPISEQLNIILPDNEIGDVSMSITNANGVVVLNKVYSSPTFTVNVSDFQQGIYFVKATTSKYNYFSKFVKQ